MLPDSCVAESLQEQFPHSLHLFERLHLALPADIKANSAALSEYHNTQSNADNSVSVAYIIRAIQLALCSKCSSNPLCILDLCQHFRSSSITLLDKFVLQVEFEKKIYNNE
jgi:hypothetical protein